MHPWTSTKDALPRDGAYTEIHVPSRLWHDKEYPKYKIARFAKKDLFGQECWLEFGPNTFSLREVTYWRYIDPAPDHPE